MGRVALALVLARSGLAEGGHTRGQLPYATLDELLTEWPITAPDCPEPLPESLPVFSAANESEMSLAKRFRAAAQPFKIVQLSGLAKLHDRWTDEYLSHRFGSTPGHVQASPTARFDTTNHVHEHDVAGYNVTTKTLRMRFTDWLKLAYDADAERLPYGAPHSAFRSIGKDFMKEDVKFLDRSPVDKRESIPWTQSVFCRFGMRGAITPAHYDLAGDNYIAMVRGAKRYILNPPSDCERLSVQTQRGHPLHRFSYLDWSDMDQVRSHEGSKIHSVQTVLREGELLYLPAKWFHTVVSVGLSIQCNRRAGEKYLASADRRAIDHCMGSHLRC